MKRYLRITPSDLTIGEPVAGLVEEFSEQEVRDCEATNIGPDRWLLLDMDLHEMFAGRDLCEWVRIQ